MAVAVVYYNDIPVGAVSSRIEKGRGPEEACVYVMTMGVLAVRISLPIIHSYRSALCPSISFPMCVRFISVVVESTRTIVRVVGAGTMSRDDQPRMSGLGVIKPSYLISNPILITNS